MTGYDFIFGVIVLLFLAGVDRRWRRYRMVKRLAKDGYTGKDIADILSAYSYDFTEEETNRRKKHENNHHDR